MKKLLALALTAVMVAALAACGGTQSGSEGGDAQTANGGADDGRSSYDQLMDIVASGDRLALSGVEPKQLEDRSGIEKGLPVEPKEKVTIGWAAASMGSTFFEGLIGSAQKAAAKYGYDLKYQVADFNLQTQQTQLDAFITQGVDVIMLNAVDLYSMEQDIKRCVDAGIPVLVTGPTAAMNDYEIITAIISGSNESGFQVGSYCAEELYKPGEVLEIGTVISQLPDADSNSRPCGWIAGYLYKSAEMSGSPYESKYDALLEAYNVWTAYKNDGKYDLSDKGLNFVGLGVGNSTDAAAGQRASAEILTANPEMDLLIVEMDSMCLGALQEIKQHNLTPGKDIKVVTCADGTRESLELIKSGEVMATATNIPYYVGQGVIELIHKIFSEGFDANNMPATSFTPTEAIHAGNVDAFYDPNDAFAKVGAWEAITIPEYNALHVND